MYCPKCGEFIPDDMSFCPKCHYQYLQEEQKTIVNEAQNGVRKTITNFFTSKYFLAISIILIIIGSFHILSGIFSLFTSSGILQLVVNVLGAVFALISGISGLYVYKKKKDLDKKQIQKINYFNNYSYIIGIVGLVLMSILLFIYLIFLLILAPSMKLIVSEDRSIIGSSMLIFYTLIIMLILLSGLGIAFIVNYFITWKKIKQYYDTLATTIETGEYKPVKQYPYVRLFVIGGIIIFLAIMQLVGTFIILSLFNVFKELILTLLKEATSANNGNYILVETYINILFNMVKFVVLLGLITIVINLLTASYMIISAISFKNIHQESLKAQEKLEQEKQKYQDVVNKTDEQLKNYLVTQSMNNNEI